MSQDLLPFNHFRFIVKSQGQAYIGEFTVGKFYTDDELTWQMLNRAEEQAEQQSIPWDPFNVNLLYLCLSH